MRTRFRRGPHRLAGVAAALSLAVAGSVTATAPTASAAVAASVSVDAGDTLATIPDTGIGMNVAVYDENMNHPDIPGLLSDAGVGMVRYPGGGYADGYHWETHTVEGGYVAPNTEFDRFMDTAEAAGAQPIITANHGSGTPEEAAEWVRHANVTHDYDIRYWEIGNEVYGNGHYGATWETDHHESKSPQTYAAYVAEYAEAMKAVDPDIEIGAVLTTPGHWPDGIVGPGDTMDWNNTVMSIAGEVIDFVIVHHYPSTNSQEDLLDAPPTEIPGMAAELRSLIDQYAGANAPDVGIAVTEAAALAYKNTSPSGVFAPDEYLTWMEHGAFTLDWWNLHNGTNCENITEVEGATDYDDGGILSSGADCEPPLNSPFPPYHGTRMITHLGSPGDALVRADSSTPLLAAHAVRETNGDVNVMLINKDPDNDITVDLSYDGFTPSPATPTAYAYLKNATSTGPAPGGTATAQTVPAYSIVVVQLRPAGPADTRAPTAPGTPTASGVTSDSATLSWTSSTDNVGVTGHEIVRVDGGAETAVATTATNSATLTGLSPGTAHTFAVYAEDAAGNRSARSGTLSVTTTGGTPGGPCTAAYRVTGEWQGGFQGGITLSCTTELSGWQLAFAFPDGQRITQMWGGRHTQTGAAVTVRPADCTRTIPAGGSVTIGFIGTKDTTNTAPESLTLTDV